MKTNELEIAKEWKKCSFKKGHSVSQELRDKISKSVSKNLKEQYKLGIAKCGFKKGYNPWNKGLHTGYSGMQGKHHSKETIEKCRMASSGENNARYGKHWSEEQKEIFRKMAIGRIFSEETKLKLRAIWKDKEYKEKQLNAIFKGLSIKPNKPETVVINLIKDNNLPFNYVGDGKIWFTGETMSFNPDFLSKNPKHIIEMFGDYWHNREDMKVRDKERLQTYEKYGYKVLIIWEHELKNLDLVLIKIKDFIFNKDLQSAIKTYEEKK